MADRNIRVVLRADVADFKRAMTDATKATDALPKSAKAAESSLGRMVQSAQYNREAWDKAGVALTAFGTATLAGLGLAAKAAMDWDSAWTGVLKTVDGSDDELAKIEDGLRALTRELPASHQEIAAVAEAAGQLGISTAGIVDFTRTMINLGETTNLSADEAATALARVRNIMGDTEADVARMGATIVDLGNNSATTEREITDMGLRLAAAGKQAGLSTSDVFAFASALTSVGVEAEAGGTAMSKVFTAIADATRDGSDDLETFARVAGVSTADFRQAFEDDAAKAITMFVEGMGRASNAGESTTAIFEDLELTDQRLMRAILSTGSATGLLGEQIDTANGAWEDNTALIIEAAKRYETAEAKVQLAKNALADTAITIGDAFLPMIAAAAEGVAGFAEWIGNLPTPLLNAVSGMAGIAGVASLAAGAFLLTFPRVMDTVKAFKDLSAISPKTATGLGKVGKAAGVAAATTAGLVALTAAVEAIGSPKRAAGIEATTRALLDMQEVDDLDSLFDGIGLGVDRVDGFADALARVADPSLIDRFQDVGGSIRGIFGKETTARTETIDQLDQIGQALAVMVDSGNAERAATQFDTLAEAWLAGGGDLEDLKNLMPAYSEALAGVENDATLAADAVEETNVALEAQIPTLEELISLQAAASGAVLSERDAQRALQQAIDDATAALEENGQTLDITTEAGRKNQAALDDIAKSGWDLIDSMQANGATQDELQAAMGGSREAFLNAATAMGIGADEANRLADEMGLIPAKVSVPVSVDTSGAQHDVDALKAILRSIPDVVITSSMRTSGGYYANRAEGGIVYGPGTSTSDSIPARLSNGEYVIKASSVSRYGKSMFDDLNAQRFSTGGYVGPSVSSRTTTTDGMSVTNNITTTDPMAAAAAVVRRLQMAGV